ncbi:MAG: class I SAM-dependent methyltransferase [Bacteroidetes bacterium]|nr:MAG: class I SAM-dependent methyltransferase [Bacteroidota bacterium]
MWNERYRQQAYVYGKKPNDFLASLDLSAFSGKVLCLAEGEGRNAVYLAGLGFEVTAIDLAEEGLKKARALAREKGVHIHTLQADLSTWAFPANAYDGIVSIFGHFPPEIRTRVHRGALKALKSGGFWVQEAYHPSQLQFKTGGPPRKELLYSLQDLLDDFQGQLELHIAREIQREVIEGAYHTGMAAVVQLFGQKK